MNYTEKFHLPQWEKSDRVLMDDFNQMCLDMEAGLDQNAQDAASGIRSAASCAEAAVKAQSTADSALSTAKAAQTAANNAFSPAYMPFQTGTYVGNGTSLTINLGFRPSFAIVTGQYVTTTMDYVNCTVLVGPNGSTSDLVKFTDTGITVSYSSSTSRMDINQSGRTFSYIAFR